jgi:hypothetical protein
VPPKVVLQIVAALVVAALVIFSAVRGKAPENAAQWLSPIGPAVLVAGIGLWVFDRYAWRWPGVCKLLGRPVLHGTWHGELASDWVNPQTGQRVPADPSVFLVVRQRYWQISTRLLTKESASASMVADLDCDGDGVYRLVYVYSNIPRAEVRHRSELHYGAACLNAPADTSHGIEGHYFTDRKTRGELRFHTRFDQLVESHAAGLALVAAAKRSNGP